MKTCTQCGSKGPFYNNKRASDKLTVWCAKCMQDSVKKSYKIRVSTEAGRKDWNERCKRRKIGRSKWTYGAFQEALKRYGYKCAICKKQLIEGNKASTPHADHSHTTDKPRAPLCLNCNSGIGYFKDNPDLMIKGAEYVQKWSREHAIEDVQLSFPW